MNPCYKIGILLALLSYSKTISANPVNQQFFYESHMISDTSSQNIDSLAICVLQGWMNYLDAILTDNCLPRNEAKLSELNTGNLNSGFFVPNQLGYWILTAILSYEVRKKYPEQTWGYEKQPLIDRLSCMMDELENILDNYAFEDIESGKKALYQAHQIDGTVDLDIDFDSIVSLLDNLYLITALHAASNWVDSIDQSLANQMRFILSQFDLSIWREEDQRRQIGPEWHLGASHNPQGGNKIDRFVTESRLVFPVALAREELDLEDFLCGLSQVRTQSNLFRSPSGVEIEYLPFFGRALEKWGPTVFLSSELESRFGIKTLFPMLYIQEEIKIENELPSSIFTGVGDGLGNFLDYTMAPSEGILDFHNVKLIIPPAEMMQAGVVAKLDSLAANNFKHAFKILADSNQLSRDWGPPNYLDFGTGLVDMNDPLRGTLEVEQGALALLNMLLGGNFVENLLRRDSVWNMAIDEYNSVLNDQYIFKEAEDREEGQGNNPTRSNACSDKTLKLENQNESACYDIKIDSIANYTLQIRYSNDGSWDSLFVEMDETEIGNIITQNTKRPNTDPGDGWNNFRLSNTINLGMLNPGIHTLCLSLNNPDIVELDLLILKGDFQFKDKFTSPVNIFSPLFPQDAVKVYPNPILSTGTLAIDLIKPEIVSVSIYDLSGKYIRLWSERKLAKGNHLFELGIGNGLVSPGIYVLKIDIVGYSNPILKRIMILK